MIAKAKEKGLYVIHEVFLNPSFSKIYAKEILEFPELDNKKDIKEEDSNSLDLDLIKYNLVDKIIVPSKYIFNAVVEKGVSKSKINIILVDFNLQKGFQIYIIIYYFCSQNEVF